jgi:hypothetical protein
MNNRSHDEPDALAIDSPDLSGSNQPIKLIDFLAGNRFVFRTRPFERIVDQPEAQHLAIGL